MTFNDILQHQTCVIIFFRRFGCQFCRLAAKEISALKPILDRKGIKLIGIGFDDIGLKQFLDRGFFDGGDYLVRWYFVFKTMLIDLFIDRGKRAYRAMGFKSKSYISVLAERVCSSENSKNKEKVLTVKLPRLFASYLKRIVTKRL